jgi:hypothetical protein
MSNGMIVTTPLEFDEQIASVAPPNTRIEVTETLRSGAGRQIVDARVIRNRRTGAVLQVEQ